MDHGLGQTALVPAHIYLESAPRTKAGYFSGRPGFRQGWQQMNAACVTLDKHFAKAGGRAEIAVDLERRMGIEQVRIDAAAAFAIDGFCFADDIEQAAQYRVGVIAVPEAGPEVDLPGPAPAGALVAAGLQGNPCGLGQLGCCRPADLAAGIQGEQMETWR